MADVDEHISDDAISSDETIDEVSNEVDPSKRQHSINYSEYISQGKGLRSIASIRRDGRIALEFDLDKNAANLPDDQGRDIEEFAVDEQWRDFPVMNIVIMIVGSRGDVQPYVALGQQLVKDGHRVRIASHETFRTFVADAGLEFFSIGGNPQDLMSYMVKNPGLMPGFETLTNGDIVKKRKMLKEMIEGCWYSCHSPCSITGRTFIADAIISNPPAFAHIHCAEALGIPLLLSFTMPWSPTSAFSHPLVNITTSNAGFGLSNYMSYTAAELLTWQGVGDIINHFRTSTLGLSALTVRSGAMLADRIRVPWTYCMSPALVPKPSDWKNNIDVVGFYFLDLATSYKPPDELVAFLDAGEPPVYIGFGSVVVDDPAAMSEIIFDATKQAGVRALVSAGWGGLGGVSVPPNVFMLGNVPHDWLFDKERVSAVVHHGGAGTTAIGLAKGRPTVVVPFFGDQGFWGSMIHKAGAGPKPIPHKELNVKKLREGIEFAISATAKEAARNLAQKIHDENGVRNGVDSFYKHLPLLNMRCDLEPSRIAIWWSTEHYMKLSTFAAQTLADEKKLDMRSLIFHRPKEHMIRKKNADSVRSAASAAIGNVINQRQVRWDLIHATIQKTTERKAVRASKYSIANAISMVHEGLRSPNSPTGRGFRQEASSVESIPPEKLDSTTSSEGDDGDQLIIEQGKKIGVFDVLMDTAGDVIDTARRTGLGLVTLPIHGRWKTRHPQTAKTQERRQRLTRVADGREAVRLSTPEQQAHIIRRFGEEIDQMPARQQLYRDAIQRAISDGMDIDMAMANGQTTNDGTRTAAASVSSQVDSNAYNNSHDLEGSTISPSTAEAVASQTPESSQPPAVGASPLIPPEDEDARFILEMEEAMRLSLEEHEANKG